jgi:hypothetical protein
MRSFLRFSLGLFLLFSFSARAQRTTPLHSYLGFDRNDYPGDASLPILRKVFSFAGYWLSAPPGEKVNSWRGKRRVLTSQGFGFLLLYAGPDLHRLKSSPHAQKQAVLDARRAAASAKSEGFPSRSTIFLDIEEGGRLTQPYYAYLRAWSDELARLGFRAGVYCSGIVVTESDGQTVITADDIRNHLGARKISYWVYNDSCPPSPGCTIPQNPPLPGASGIAYASVWQFVRSPRDQETAHTCSGYAANGNCYIALDTARQWHLDLNLSISPNPSLSH